MCKKYGCKEVMSVSLFVYPYLSIEEPLGGFFMKFDMNTCHWRPSEMITVSFPAFICNKVMGA
jgi:hypothetical protein